MSHINVGVLRGGPTDEYDVSLKTGQHILNMLKSEPLSKAYKGVDILIDKEGVWHMDGMPATPEQVLRTIDVVFNATKGNFDKGEPLHRVLESFAVPFVGTKGYASAMTKNKPFSKKHFKEQGIKTPYFRELNLSQDQDLQPIAVDVFRSFPMPVIVKPVGKGSSLGVSFASNFQELVEALDHARGFSDEVLVEEYLTGKEIISGFIDDFRGQNLYHMFPVEVKPHQETQESHVGSSIEGLMNQNGLNMFSDVKPSLSDIEADEKTVETSIEDLSPEEQEIARNLVLAKSEQAGQTAIETNIDSVAPHFITPKKPKHSIFNWIAKHAGLYDHTSPANITSDEKKIIEDAVRKVRESLGLRH
ncbi:MAG: D-alanine-D-alanine ligase, partial [Patescibacteria group bacterium]|nr:D-alanine-D-alanine ligase [Patescibacteria group bacterium]